jgi:hypothetical protein
MAEKPLVRRPRPAGTPPRRRDERPARPPEPAITDDVSWQDLDRAARAELRSLPKELAERVGGHLAMAGLLIDTDPTLAREHAAVARRLAQRVAVVREAVALTAYACGDYESALAELRAYRRLSGDQSHLPLMADCERGLGRPSRALELATSDAAATLPAPVQRELRIVAAGARSDLGQDDAALALLEQDPALLARTAVEPSVLRLRYAYADTLARLGRDAEAAQWFRLVAASDDGATDAADRVGHVD